jgi:hypothetical protein
MRSVHIAVERLVDVPADVVYHCLADSRGHHRAGELLPPVFTDPQVLRGGAGAGPVIRFTTRMAGRTVPRTQEVSEPAPGRVLVEWGDGEGSTFSVEPRGERSLVRIDSVVRAGGLEGLLLAWLGRRLLRPIIADELARRERYAQAHREAGIALGHEHSGRRDAGAAPNADAVGSLPYGDVRSSGLAR